MARAAAKRSGAAPAAKAKADDTSGLIGSGPREESKPVVEQTAQKPGDVTSQNQEDGRADPRENSTDPSTSSGGPKGPDNNKRLAFLEERNLQLALALAAHGAAPTSADGKGYDDPIEVAIGIVRSAPPAGEASEAELAAISRAETAEARIAELDAMIDRHHENRRLVTRALIEIGTPPGPDDSPLLMAADFINMMAQARAQAAADAAQASPETAAAAESAGKAPEKAGRSSATAQAKADAAARAEAEAAYAAAIEGRVRSFAALGLAPGADGVVLRFADANGFLPALPPRPIVRGMVGIDAAGHRITISVPIDLPPDMPAAHITEAWLIAGAQAVQCFIPGGIRAGGGVHATFPKGHLTF